MRPILEPGSIVVGSLRFRGPRPGEIVVLRHAGLEKIKRIKDIKDNQVFVVGDNPDSSTDSRSFGWLPTSAIMAKVIWPLGLSSSQIK